MDWLIPAVIASLLWGIGQTLIKRGLTDVPPFISNVLWALFGMCVEIPYALHNGVNWQVFPTILLFGLFANLPNYIFPYVLAKANVSLAGTVLAIYPVFTIVLSILFLKELVVPIQLLGIAGIIIGMFFVAKIEGEKFNLAPWIIWALGGAILIGLGDFIGKVSIIKFDLYSFIMAFTLANVICIPLSRLIDRSPIKFEGNWNSLGYSILGNLFMPTGLLFLYIAFSKGPASLASPVASTYPAITVVLAYLFLKEKISHLNFFGIALVTLGVVLIGI